MFILAFVSLAAYAQSLTVTGKVIDSEGYEVIGGSVTIKGVAGVGTVTDVNGNYTLKVNDASKDVLVFSYVGMTPQEVKVNNRSVINVTLQADAVLLEDVVVIGYAAVPRRDLTGSVTSVSSKELSKVPVSDVTQALTGRMAGVMVQQSEGTPGASISVRVRGGISITQSNEPLYIIDGFPSEDGMSTLDPAEIEAILNKAPESMAGMIEGMIKQHMPNYGKELNVQETTVYKPEYSWNYEVGSHLSLFNGKLKTDLAAFYMDTHDQQIAKFVNSGLGRMMVNAGSSESYGVEASFLASINKNLNMNVSYGYTHSTFKKYDGGTTSSEEQIDYSGNYVPFVPRHTMNAGANYSFFFDKSNWMQSLTLGMSYTGAGKIYWTEKNNVSQSFYGTLNGRISLQTKALQIDVWGRNLTNKDYTTFYFETMHRGFEQKSRPLQLGVDIRYHF